MDTKTDIYSKMQAGQPFKAFKKTVPVWLHIVVLDPFDDKKTEIVHLKGDPDKNEIECYVPLWSEKDYLFFKRANRIHINAGRLVEATYPTDDDLKTSPDNLSDDEMAVLLSAPFMKLKRAVEGMKSEAAIYRMIKKGEALERPEKTMNFLRERLSLVQSGMLERPDEE